MSTLNKSISQLKPSATLLINETVKRLRTEGNKIVHFGFGQSPFPISKKIVKELQKHASCNHYLPTVGLLELRNEIATFLGRYQNIKTTGKLIFIGPGSKELLYQTILIFNGTYLIPKGSWVSYLPQVKAANKNAIVLDTKFQDNFKLQPEVLDGYCKTSKSEEKLLILNSPNNPSGAVYSELELEKIAKVCKKYDITVLSDEIYSQVSYETKFAPSISKYYPEKTIVFGGLSKVFSAGGYRLGFMVLPKKLENLQSCFQSLFSETFSAVSAPIQFSAIKAYKYQKTIKKHVESSVEILNTIGNYVYENLTQHGIYCTKPQGGFYVLIGFNQFKDTLAKKQLTNSIDLGNYILETQKVALLPGVDFYFSPEELFFRLAYVDFDGEVALNSYKNDNLELDKEFIKTYAPNIVKGIRKIIKWVNSLK